MFFNISCGVPHILSSRMVITEGSVIANRCQNYYAKRYNTKCFLTYHLVFHTFYCFMCRLSYIVVMSSHFLFFKSKQKFGNRRVCKNDGWSCKKKTYDFSTLDRGLRCVQKYNVTEKRVYSRGVPKNIFFKNMLLSVHIEPT